MKQFFKYMLATMVGIILVNVIGFFIFIGVIAMVFAGSNKETDAVKDKSILVLKFDYEITERTSSNPFDNFDFSTLESKIQPGLNDILKNIEKATYDPNIKGIYLNVVNLNGTYGTLSEIRDKLSEFKKSGKFIIANGEFYSQRAYYLASVADKIYLTPQGTLFFNGLSTNAVFLGSLFDKIGVDFQVFKGPNNIYKSSPDMYTNDKYSAEASMEMQVLVNNMWNDIIKDIALSRNISADSLNYIADNFTFFADSQLVKNKIIDGLVFKDQVFDEIKEKIGISKSSKINWVDLSDYYSVIDSRNEYSKNKIAVVYAYGTMVPLDASEGNMSAEKISASLRGLRSDSAIGAVVLRINSGGGSSQAAEIIWRELELLKKVKPVVVSMGDVAASGGYYISSPADSIFAERFTITGSIGVFGVIPNAEELYKKIGLSTDGVKTNRYSDFLSNVNRPLNESEGLLVQKAINSVYDVFLTRVSNGRSMPYAYIDSIGRGRVWSASDALKVGLVDTIGTLSDAVKAAAFLAGYKQYRTVDYPKVTNDWMQVFSNMQANVEKRIEQKIVGEYIDVLNTLKQVESMDPIQTRIPYLINVK